MAGKLKIYGNMASPYSDIVLLTVAEGGLKDYDYVNVDFRKGAHKLSPHEPDGKIPCSHNPGRRPSLRVSPNGEIHRHTLHVTDLLPDTKDALALARFEQAPVDEAAVAKAKSQLESHLDLCEQSLKAGKEYMAGDSFGLADIFYIPAVAELIDVGHGDLITKREMVNDWWQRCLARPATGDYVQNIPKPVDMKQPLDRAN
uniref:glutathione transferase n=1 Tax=Coccidioides posadasii RMSCC 3488 TaxID=454284 RepID=A0A0J6F4L1_COCPO|nr:glutathione transferase F5 [Coccidioides posadasii RMSCC 3488]